MIFNDRIKTEISKRYPDVKWTHIIDVEGTSFWHDIKSLEQDKCQFLKPTGGGKHECIIYDLRPPICSGYGDHEYILHVCHTNPRFNREEFNKEQMLVNLDDASANQRQIALGATLFTK